MTRRKVEYLRVMNMINRGEFLTRRNSLLAKMPICSLAIVYSSSRIERTFGTYYRFRPRSDFYYLTGFEEPEACAVFISDGMNGQYILFSRPSNDGEELLEGRYLGQERAFDEHQVDQAYPIDQLDNMLPNLLVGIKRVYCQIVADDRMGEIARSVRHLLGKVRSGVTFPSEICSLDDLLQEMRFCKSDSELSILKKTVDITVRGHLRAISSARPGMFEYELEAELNYEYIKSGAQPAYSSVVCAGVKGCVMHHREINNKQIKSGDLVMIDSGAEFNFYSADLARTFPIDGKFSREQKAIYEIVLKAQISMIALIRPGVNFAELEETAAKILTRGLLDLEIINGSYEEKLHEKAYKAFFPHNVGHWIGMDIHDEITYRLPNGNWRPFKPGAVLTVEPGLYIVSQEGVDSRWWNIGVHIEDMILVTSNGHEVLSSALPKSVDEIEAIIH